MRMPQFVHVLGHMPARGRELARLAVPLGGAPLPLDPLLMPGKLQLALGELAAKVPLHPAGEAQGFKPRLALAPFHKHRLPPSGRALLGTRLGGAARASGGGMENAAHTYRNQNPSCKQPPRIRCYCPCGTSCSSTNLGQRYSSASNPSCLNRANSKILARQRRPVQPFVSDRRAASHGWRAELDIFRRLLPIAASPTRFPCCKGLRPRCESAKHAVPHWPVFLTADMGLWRTVCYSCYEFGRPLACFAPPFQFYTL